MTKNVTRKESKMARKKRDIYKSRKDDGFNINRDVDLQHLRYLMSVENIGASDYNYYALYCKNIIRIMFDSAKFKYYDDDVKEDMESEAIIDMLKARTKFNAIKFTEATAPFNYLYRIAFHSFQHILKIYYRFRSNCVPCSSIVSTDFDITEKATTEWSVIADNYKVLKESITTATRS